MKHGHDVTMYKVWETKQKAVARIYGDFDESYAELPRFLAALSDADLNTVTTLKCNPRVSTLQVGDKHRCNAPLWQVQRKVVDSNGNRW